MRAFTFVSFLTVALFGSQVMAAPMEPHMIAKREAICSANVRTISNNDCLQNNQGNNYTWTAPSNIAMKSVTGVPSGSTCNQIVDTAMLNQALNDHQICNLLRNMQSAKKDLNKDNTLKPLTDIITNRSNLNFLDNKVADRKKEVLSNAQKNKGQKTDDVGKAVGNYLNQVKGSAQSIAHQLDGKIYDIIQEAQKIHDGLDTKKAVNKLQKTNLQHAIDLAKKTGSPVFDDLNKVYNSAPHS